MKPYAPTKTLALVALPIAASGETEAYFTEIQ